MCRKYCHMIYCMQVENHVDLVINYHDLLHASRKYLLLIVSVVFLSISAIASFSSSDLKKLSSLNMHNGG
jgi:hypothetical protein